MSTGNSEHRQFQCRGVWDVVEERRETTGRPALSGVPEKVAVEENLER